jgi:hypothetical protein
MKNKFFKFLYKIFSFLADKTNGWKIFVNPKLFFGALIVGGITAVSMPACIATCYDPISEEPEQLCYVSIPPKDTMPEKDTVPDVLCYAVGEDTIPQNDTISEVMCYDIAPPNVE